MSWCLHINALHQSIYSKTVPSIIIQYPNLTLLLLICFTLLIFLYSFEKNFQCWIFAYSISTLCSLYFYSNSRPVVVEYLFHLSMWNVSTTITTQLISMKLVTGLLDPLRMISNTFEAAFIIVTNSWIIVICMWSKLLSKSMLGNKKKIFLKPLRPLGYLLHSGGTKRIFRNVSKSQLFIQNSCIKRSLNRC